MAYFDTDVLPRSTVSEQHIGGVARVPGSSGIDVSEEDLLISARTVIHSCLEVREHENVLIVTDTKTTEIARAVYEASSEVTSRVLMMMMPELEEQGIEPPSPVSDLMKRQDVIFLLTTKSMTHTRARATASREGARIASIPGVGVESFAKGGFTADHNAMATEISSMGSRLRRAREVRITSSLGTDLRFEAGSRWILEDTGICTRPGQVTNLPAGRVFVMPKEGTAQGRLILDGSWEGNELEKPLQIVIKDGLLSSATGDPVSADIESGFKLASEEMRTGRGHLVRTFSEFSFGMNPRAKRGLGLLEDQCWRGGAMFAFGNNVGLGGSANVTTNVRGLLIKPTIEIDGRTLVTDGKYTPRSR